MPDEFGNYPQDQYNSPDLRIPIDNTELNPSFMAQIDAKVKETIQLVELSLAGKEWDYDKKKFKINENLRQLSPWAVNKIKSLLYTYGSPAFIQSKNTPEQICSMINMQQDIEFKIWATRTKLNLTGLDNIDEVADVITLVFNTIQTMMDFGIEGFTARNTTTKRVEAVQTHLGDNKNQGGGGLLGGGLPTGGRR